MNLGKDFWWFRGGQFLSQLGSKAQLLATSWWILETTGSASSMAMIFVPTMLVWLVFIPLLAPFGDRYSRKKLMFIADLGSLILITLSAFLFATSLMNLYILIIITSLTAGFDALFNAGENAVITNLVPTENVNPAMRQIESLNSITTLLGGMFGASLVAVIGITGTVTINAITFFASLIGIIMIKSNTQPIHKITEITKNRFKQWNNDIFISYRDVFHIKVLFGTTIVIALVELAIAPFVIIIPYIVKESLSLSSWYLGIAETGAGVGMFAAASTLAFIMKFLNNFRAINIYIFGIALCCFFIGLFENYWVFVGLISIAHLLYTFINIIINSHTIVSIPDHYRARFCSIISLTTGVASTIAFIITGILIDLIGVWKLLIYCGIYVFFIIPIFYFIPYCADFYNHPSEYVADWLKKRFPNTFN